ncbi:MAG TPA: GNAT family N-acetyltransferase [Nitriliruptorales bacterium]
MIGALRGVRWRRVDAEDLHEVVRRLSTWPAEVGGGVRHQFPLASIEAHGPDIVRVAEQDDLWAAAIVLPGKVVVPCGDGRVIGAAGPASRRWRLLVGDAGAGEPMLEPFLGDAGIRVHVQRFLTAEAERIPAEADVPDPGLRLAQRADIAALAELAAQLHVDDEFGPDPGRPGRRGYATRLESSVDRGLIWCVGPIGDPIVKVEQSVRSGRWGVQLAGIVVNRSHRGSGLGTAAVAEAVRRTLADDPQQPVSLHVRAANTPALHAYARAGFVDREEWRLAVRP